MKVVSFIWDHLLNFIGYRKFWNGESILYHEDIKPIKFDSKVKIFGQKPIEIKDKGDNYGR